MLNKNPLKASRKGVNMGLIWQVDFYRSSVSDISGQVLWELLICDPTRNFEYTATCLQSQANSSWLTAELKLAMGGKLPDVIQVFRPQSLGLIQIAGNNLGIKIEPTRRTFALKKTQQVDIDKPPPVPLPENLWGKEWRLATILTEDLVDRFAERPIPVLDIPEFLYPIHLGLADQVPVPGMVIYAGRQSMALVRWLQQVHPVALNYIAGAPDGWVLEAGLVDRWIIATFTDAEAAIAAQVYEQRKQLTQGLHFLLVQPDDSEMTYSGFWLLQ
jgi:hypothetical protein